MKWMVRTMKEITIQISDCFSRAISLTCMGEVTKHNKVNVTVIAALIEDQDTIIINDDGTFEIANDNLADEYKE